MIIYHDLFGLLPEKQGCFNIYKSINAIHPINELKDRNHTFVSTEDGMAFDKNLHLLIIKVFKKIQRTQHNMIRAMATYSQCHTKWGKTYFH